MAKRHGAFELRKDKNATVKLEVQLLHLPPPPLERSGNGGGGRCKLGFGSSGNTK